MMPQTKISPFDLVAARYDEDFTQSKIGLLQRQRVWHLLTPLLQSYHRPLDILEINCGTGEDALQLAKLGHHVIATDASEQMIRQAKLKASKASSIKIKPEFVTCSFNQLVNLHVKKPFDLVISNFGGLNCIDEKEMNRLASVLSGITTDNSRLLLVVMGKICLWEVFYFSVKGKFNSAFRRLKPSIPFNVDTHTITVYYYSPRRVLNIFKNYFTQLSINPVGLFIPPSYLESTFVKRPNWLQTLNRWEIKFGLTAFSSLADHYCLILNKNKP